MMKSDIPQKQKVNSLHQNSQTKCYKNWQKVRNMVKKLKNNQFINHHKTEHGALQYQSNLLINKHMNYSNFIWKKQQKLKNQQIQLLLRQRGYQKSHNQDSIQKANDNLFRESQILRSNNTLTCNNKQQISIVTFRPVPKIDYLAHQQVGTGQIDTTGVWIWQAQEAMTNYLCCNFNDYNKDQINILQLGAGCSGLAALAYTKFWQKYHIGMQKVKAFVLITDGKSDNIAFIRKNIQQNFPKQGIFSEKPQIIVDCSQYLWGSQIKTKIDPTKEQYSEFDLILAADCLFFQSYHHQLIQTLAKYLKAQTGVALFVNPQRGNSLSNFIKQLQKYHSEEYKLSYKFICCEDKAKKQCLQADDNKLLYMQVKKKLIQ